MLYTTTSWRRERACCQYLEEQRPDKPDHSRRRPLTPLSTPGHNAIAPSTTLQPDPPVAPTSMLQTLKTKVRTRLHVSRPESTTPTQKTFDQTQAPLLQLPAELRNAIFQEVVGGRTLHLATYDQRIHHVACTGDESCSGCETRRLMLTEHPMKRLMVADWVAYFSPDETLLPLLMTCRRVYSEAVGLLYSTNTFDFADLFTFLDFIATIPPPRVNQIHHVNLSWLIRHQMYPDKIVGFLPPFHRSTWEDVWMVMASLRGLLSLNVQLAEQYLDGQTCAKSYWYLHIIEPIVALETNADVRISIPRFDRFQSVPRAELKQRMIDEIPPDDAYNNKWLDNNYSPPTGPTPSGADRKCSYCNSLPQRRLVSLLRRRCKGCSALL